MAFSNGSLLGQFYSPTGTLAGAFASSNPTNPNETTGPRNIFTISAPGDVLLLSVNSSGTVNAPGVSSKHIGSMLGAFYLTAAQAALLPANATASQVCQAMYPLNSAGLDIFQVVGEGGQVIFRLTSTGVGATS